MPSAQVTLSATPTLVPIANPTGRIVVTIISAAAEVYATADGSYPSAPSGTPASNPPGLMVIAGVVGAQGVLQPPLFGDHMAAPTVRLASSGNPVVSVEW